MINILGNLDVATLPHSTLRNKYLCQLHFKKESFATSERLFKTAVPVNFKDIEDYESFSSNEVLKASKRKYEPRYIPEYSPNIRKQNLNLSVCSPQPSTSRENILLETILDLPSPITTKRKSNNTMESPKSRKIKRMSFHLRSQYKMLASKWSQISKLKKANKRNHVLDMFQSAT